MSALSQFPRLSTIESCEGRGEKNAFVYFEYGVVGGRAVSKNSWERTSQFVFGFIAPGLWDKVQDACSLSMELYMGTNYMVIIHIVPSALKQVESAINELYGEWVNLSN